ncbi:MAG: hypothetical protein ACT4PX_00440 [Actinomycetota bacterium]
MLDSVAAVERVLWSYTDALQVRTSSVIPLSSGRDHTRLPFHRSFIEDLDARAELRGRMGFLDPRDRELLLRWYVQSVGPEAIARHLGCSVRQVYRRRAAALVRLVELGRADEFADADVAEFA